MPEGTDDARRQHAVGQVSVAPHEAVRVEAEGQARAVAPEGLARNTMVSVVTQLVLLIVVDGFVAAFLNAVL